MSRYVIKIDSYKKELKQVEYKDSIEALDADDIVLELDIDTMSVDMAMDEWDDDMAYDAPSPSYDELLEFVTFSPIELWFAASPSEYASKWKFKDIMIEGDALITLDEKTMTQKELQEFYPVIKELVSFES